MKLKNLKKLKNKRDEILLTEIGAYLHLIGRYCKEFIETYSEPKKINYDYKKVCENNIFFENSELRSLFTDNIWGNKLSLENLGISNGSEEKYIINFCDFINEHTRSGNQNNYKCFCKILTDAHGIVSGIDKALAGGIKGTRQKIPYIFRSSAFGYETKIELYESYRNDIKNNTKKSNSKNVKKKNFKTKFLEELQGILEKIRDNQSSLNQINFEIYCQFKKIIFKYYPLTIGETRRPINEISLLDYAHLIASLTKSNLVKMILTGKWYNPLDKKIRPNWRILCINIDIIGLISRGIKIGDIFGNKREIESILNIIKFKLEFVYPIGNELYRDSTGIYFSCPDLNDKELEDFKNKIKKIIRKLNFTDFNFHIEVSKPSRSITIISEMIDNGQKEIYYHYKYNIQKFLKHKDKIKDDEIKDICSICRIRLKKSSDTRCDKCNSRYENRVKTWLENPKNTIWMDEIADHNGRVALLLGMFDLKNWLSGDFLNTFLSRTFSSWRENNESVCTKLNIESIDDLRREFNNLIIDENRELDSNQIKLLKSLISVREIKNFKDDIYYPLIERDSSINIEKLKSSEDKAKAIVRLLFRKHPSPARLYRIWNSTYKFIKNEIFENILKNIKFKTNFFKESIRRKRILFKLKLETSLNEKLENSTLLLEVNSLVLNIFCIDVKNQKFISIENLEYAFQNFGKEFNEILENFKNKTCKLKLDNKEIVNGIIIQCHIIEDEKFNDYYPWLKIYDFPDRFMMLVPASKSINIMKKIIKKYDIYFSKVKDRLPLHLGIVFFPRKMPLYTVIDSGEKILTTFKEKSRDLDAKVINFKVNENYKSVKVRLKLFNEIFQKNNKIFNLKMRYNTGDPDVDDIWHPYIRINHPKNIEERKLFIKEPPCIHIKKLKENDEIKIRPSLFSYINLDSNIRRFESGNKVMLIEDFKDMIKIWNYLKYLYKNRDVSSTKIKNLEFLMKIKKEEWNSDKNFKNLIKTILIKEFNLTNSNNKIFNFFYDSIMNDLFFDTLEIFLRILKKKLEVE
ncbi:MAG: CRISPR-associated protein Csx11 [Promethearchaeia archaeon]